MIHDFSGLFESGPPISYGRGQVKQFSYAFYGRISDLGEAVGVRLRWEGARPRAGGNDPLPNLLARTEEIQRRACFLGLPQERQLTHAYMAQPPAYNAPEIRHGRHTLSP